MQTQRHVAPRGRPASPLDPVAAQQAAARELLRHHLAIAIVLYVMGIFGALLYLLLTPKGPNRWVLDLMVAGALVLIGAVATFGARRVADATWVHPFIFGWTVTTVVMVSAAAALDGGADSPLALLLVIQAVFVSLVLPLPGVRWIAALVQSSFAALAVQHAGSGGRCVFEFVLIAMGNVMALATANSRDRYRRAEGDLRNRLADAATHDSVTGCLSHKAFMERVQEEVERAVRSTRPLSLLMIDIDHFKQVNDKLGHQTGDRALLQVARAAIEAVRTVDHVGRLGGDEFGVIMPNTDSLGAKIVARRVQAAVGVATADIPITVSVGIAELIDASGLRGLVESADRALYRAKGRRNTVVAASDAASGGAALGATSAG